MFNYTSNVITMHHFLNVSTLDFILLEHLMPIYMTRIKRLHNECSFSFYNPFLCHRCGTSGWVGRRITGVILPAGIRTEVEGVYGSRRSVLFLKMQVLSTFPLDWES